MNTSPSLLLSPRDYAPLFVILGMPLLGAIVNGIFGKRLGRPAVTLMALVAVGASFLASALSLWLLVSTSHDATAAKQLTLDGWEWMRVSGFNDFTQIPITFGFTIDALNGVMAVIVTGVGFLIHLYSTKYMCNDPSYHRFFAYLNLFIFAMLVLILGNGLPVLFVGWEGVGLCSYLLIGFWFTDKANAAAGTKAFIVNRIGDFGLLVAMGLLVHYVGALDYAGIKAGAFRLAEIPVEIWSGSSALAYVFGRPLEMIGLVNAAHWVMSPGYATAATLIGLSLFLGCAGKSAQIPLYVWLPDAMAGPTPVSALIHAATMVTAGVYLVCRMSPVFALSPFAMLTVAMIGALTAVFAATIAFAQRDIKKVLAYSTVSQLGYMFLGVGVGAFTAGFFHVVTHAFFKACLFLGAGSVIHAMHARIHGTTASQDMNNMGGLRRYMPVTFITFLASWAAIVGFPLTSGFFSKDEILFQSFTLSVSSPVKDGLLHTPHGPERIFVSPPWVSAVLLVLGTLGAVMTAFYMTRLVVGIFAGQFRGWTISNDPQPHAHDSHSHDHDEHATGEAIKGPAPHESPWAMTLPLVILAVLALFGGLLNATAFFHYTPLEHFLSNVFGEFPNIKPRPDSEHLEHVLLLPGLLAFVAGTAWALWVFLYSKGRPARRFIEQHPKLHRLALEKWRVDEFYQETIVGSLQLIADMCVWFDKWIVDGLFAGLTSFVVSFTGSALRLFQTGRVQSYAAFIVLGMAGLGYFMNTPHAEATVTSDDSSGKYTLTAAPGLGYSYRWDSNGDGQFETSNFGTQTRLDLDLDRTERRTVVLQVRDSFGRQATRKFRIERPAEDLSGAAPRSNQVLNNMPHDRNRNDAPERLNKAGNAP
jgi:NADH-quinone oxidoreductase subunit L